MPIHKVRIPKDWLLFFSANMPHGVWRLPSCHRTIASLTHRGHLTPTFSTKAHSKRIRSEDGTHLYEIPLNLFYGGIQFFCLRQGLLIYVAPRRHRQKQHMLKQLKTVWDVVSMSGGGPGTREAWQAGHLF